MILGTLNTVGRLVPMMSLVLLCACQSSPAPSRGVNPNYAALNPTRILAVTPLIVSLPYDKSSVIDPVVLETVPVVDDIERLVLDSFRDQPGVNGVSFGAVRQALKEKDSDAFGDLVRTLNKTIQTMRQPQRLAREELSQSCLSPQTFIGFYLHCLEKQKLWQQALNGFSLAAFNADAALLLFVTELRGQAVGAQRIPVARLEALLLDTNNGEIIWSGSSMSERNAPDGESLSDPQKRWQDVLSRMVSESLWLDFPGRRPPPPLLDDKPGIGEQQ